MPDDGVRQRGRVTINDVAARAGVSVATVSRVVNDRYGVAKATSAKVRDVIAELGYASSLGAHSMRSTSTGVVGVLMSRVDPYGSQVLRGVAEVLQDGGQELLLFCPSSEHLEGWERTSVARIGGTMVDATVLVAPTVVDVASERPVVAVDPHVGASHLHTVAAENTEGAVAATRYLLELGHRRIGFLGGRKDLESSRLRETGHRRALMEAGVPFDPQLVQHGDYTEEGADVPARLLLARRERPTAVFAANDRSALKVVEVASELGLRVPEDLSVVGFDDIPEASRVEPGLTTIDQSLHQLGAEAARLVLDLLDPEQDAPPEPVHRRLPTSLVVRGSTAPPPTTT